MSLLQKHMQLLPHPPVLACTDDTMWKRDLCTSCPEHWGNGFNYLLIIVCPLTRYVIVVTVDNGNILRCKVHEDSNYRNLIKWLIKEHICQYRHKYLWKHQFCHMVSNNFPSHSHEEGIDEALSINLNWSYVTFRKLTRSWTFDFKQLRHII